MRPLVNLDFLRAFAIVLVVLDHVLLSLGVEQVHGFGTGLMGIFGVYLFFVHTSLVLMWSLERRPNVLDFYIRRAFRIYPLAIVVTLVAAFTHAAVGGFFATTPWTGTSLLVNLALMTDIVRPSGRIVGVTWSLGPEVLMYLLLPALFFYARAMRRVWPILVLWLVVVAYDHHNFPIEQANSFAVLIPDFLAGVVAYVGFMKRPPVLPGWTFPAALLLLWGVYVSLRSLRGDWPICLATALLLPYFRQMAAGWWTRAAHQIAEHSYAIYLLHSFGLLLGVHLLPRLERWQQLLVFFAFTAPMAWLSYRVVERPMIVFGARVAAKLASERYQQPKETLEPAP